MLGKRSAADRRLARLTPSDRLIGRSGPAGHVSIRPQRPVEQTDLLVRANLLRHFHRMSLPLKEIQVNFNSDYRVCVPANGNPNPWVAELFYQFLWSYVSIGGGDNQRIGTKIFIHNIQIGGHIIASESASQTTPMSFRWALVRYPGVARMFITSNFTRPVWPALWSFTNASGTYVLAEDYGAIINHFANNPTYNTFYQPTNSRIYGCYEFPSEVIPVNGPMNFAPTGGPAATPEDCTGNILLWFWRDRLIELDGGAGDQYASYTIRITFRVLYRDV